MKRSIIKLTVKQSSAILLFTIFSLNLWSQKNPYNEVSIASPTAASLGKYADIPVNNHTGIPNISIPLYSVREGDLELPVSLGYHAAGLKVMEQASWVGAGWSLNAGGVITRTVRGAPDEKGTSSLYNQAYGYFSDYGYASYSFYLNGTPETYEFQEGKRDGEPDLFSFNVGGLSGKFYFRDDRTPIFEPQQNIKVEYNYTGSGSIQSFVLTGPDGVRYHFGIKNETTGAVPIERTNPVTAQSGYVQGTVISSWYLSKIESADGLSIIKLNYVAENYSYYTISMFPVTPNNQGYEYNLIKNIVNGVRLSNITFSNGKVTFLPGLAREDLSSSSTAFTPETLNTESKTLGRIEVDNNGSFCKKYVFSYDYFIDNTPLQGYFSGYGLFTDKKRLKLNSVQELTCDGSVSLPARTFEYFTEQVPRRLSFGQDHWGFYNGITSNTKLIPTYTVDEFETVSGANRDASWPAMRGGALKKITYPTGGSSTFDFEPNDTWVNYSKKQWTSAFYISAGYDGSSAVVTSNQIFSGNIYNYRLVNSASGSQVLLNIYNSANTLVESAVLEPGQSTEKRVQFPAGTYRITLQKLGAISGSGAQLYFDQWTSTSVQKNETVGGLRIKTLTHNDGSGNIGTSYKYLLSNGQSSGVLYSRPAYVQVVRSDQIAEAGLGGPYGQGSPINNCNPNGCISCDWGASLGYYESPCGIRPLASSQGNHIGYNEVKVSQTGNGNVVYRYYGSDRWDTKTDDVAVRTINTKPPCSLSIPNYPEVPLPYEPKRGELKSESYYTESGQYIKEVTYYPVYAEETVKTPGKIPGSFGGWSFNSYYDITAVKKIEHTIVETLIASSSTSIPTTSSTYFESPYHYQPDRRLIINSTGQNTESKFKYAADFRITSCDAISDCYQSYQTDVTNYTIQYQQQRYQCSTDGCVWNNYQTYRANLTLARRAYITCRKSYSDPGNTSGFAYCKINAKNTAGTELKPILELQVQNDFTPLEVTQWVAGKLTKASFNRYDYASNPATSVYPSKLQAISLSVPSPTFTPSTISGNTIVKDTRYTDETSLKYDKGNMVELTKKDGIVTSFIWGYNNNFPVAKVIGASYSSINGLLTQSIIQSPSSDAVLRTELNKIRQNLPLALAATYTYKPLVGITSETDANGKTIYYQYDALGRLVFIRDKDNNVIKKICYNYQGQTENCNPVAY